jgi:hypothetical protein
VPNVDHVAVATTNTGGDDETVADGAHLRPGLAA